MPLPFRARGVLAASAVSLLFAVTACGSQEAPAAAPATTGATGGTTAPVTMKDPWVKTARSGMSAAYGTLMNSSGSDIVVVSATSTASAMMELHETTTVGGKMAMQPKQGGFSIPANGSHELKPGGDHLMLMSVTSPVQPGDEVTITLTLKGGGTVRITALGKDFAGGNESYHPGDGSGMPMGG